MKSENKKNEILKQAGIYSFGTQLTQVITLVAAIVSRRFLGPTQTGIWATLQIVVDYSKYATMGVLDAAAREIPLLLGRDEKSQAEEIKNLTFTFIIYSSLVLCGLIASAAFIFRSHFRQEVVYGLFFVAAVIFLQRVNNLLISLLRCYKKFHVEAGFMIVSAIVNAVLVSFLTYKFKIYGFIVALILSFVFNIVFLVSRYDYRFKWVSRFESLKPLLVYGFPLMIIGILGTLVKSVDKIVITKALGFEALGYYSIALMACSYIGNYAISVAIVLVPHFQERFGKQKNAEDLEVYLLKASKAYALTMPMMIGLAWFGVPLAVDFLLPKFGQGIHAMKILVLSLYFIALIQPFHDFLITIKKHLLLIPILMLSALMAVVFDISAIRAGWGIEGVALGAVGTFLCNFMLVFFVAARYFRPHQSALGSFLKRLGVFVYFSTFLFLLERSPLNQLGHPVYAFLGGALAFTVVCLPFFWMLNHEFSLIRILRNRLAKSFH